MPNDLTLLTITAASMGFFHTLFGQDHYLPFIMMAGAMEGMIKERDSESSSE
jgi:hypothetical protein